MSVISLEDRETLSEEDFLSRASGYGSDVRSAGTRWWIYTPGHQGPRSGTPRTPQELIEYVRSRTFRGEPIYRIVGSRTYPGWMGLAYTQAGVAYYKSLRYWSHALESASRPSPE